MTRRTVMIAVCVVVVCAAVAVCLITGKNQSSGSGDTADWMQKTVDPETLDGLKKKYPEYFGLSTSKGLEVYVWQMAAGSYSWALMPGTDREKTAQELWGLKGTTTEEMRAILSSYSVSSENIFVIPFQNPISSYCYRIDDDYAQRMRSFLFSDSTVAEESAEELFSIIMSSPMYSSNSKDYLDAHEEAHQKLLKDKDGTLKYIFGEFLRGMDGHPENGLKGVLMRTILEELAPESVIDLAGTPQEYFNAWLDMAKQRTEGHDDKWIQKNYPAEYILLQMVAEK